MVPPNLWRILVVYKISVVLIDKSHDASKYEILNMRTWVTLAVFLCTFAARASIFYVATNGSDANPGTILAAPFQTIQHAATNMLAGDTCYVLGGVYRETLSPARSGTAAAPITFAAYSNEVVTIDACDLVTGWTLLSNGIYQASAKWNLGEGYNQVFVDGAMAHEAQFPDYGSGDVLHPATVPVTIYATNTAQIISPDFAGHPNNYWAGAWFSGGVGLSWSWQTAQVLSSTGTVITVNPSTETTDWWFTGSGNGYLWGKFNLLDADNEWYLQTNSAGNILNLRVIAGGNPSSHAVELKRRDWCVDFNGQNYITVTGLNLWVVPSKWTVTTR